MAKLSYRGWVDCYKLENEFLTLIINVSSGGKVQYFGRKGINLIYEDNRQDGLILEDFQKKKFDPDGGRFDYGPEELTDPVHALTYVGPWKMMGASASILTIESLPDLQLGLRSGRTFRLMKDKPGLQIIQTMHNISDSPLEYFFWGRTLVNTGGKLFMPLNPESIYPDKWGRYIWGNPHRFSSDPEDTGVSLEDGFFNLFPDRAKNEKYGTDNKEGWMAYGYRSLIFLKKYPFYPNGKYTELFGQTGIFYTNRSTFAEMEPISPAALLTPGEEYTFTEEWYLPEYQKAENSGFNTKEAVDFLKKHSYL